MKVSFFSFIFFVFISLSISADTKTSEESIAEVVVTATRTPQTITKVLSSTTVINTADIERYQPTDLLDLFQHVPGMK